MLPQSTTIDPNTDKQDDCIYDRNDEGPMAAPADPLTPIMDTNTRRSGRRSTLHDMVTTSTSFPPLSCHTLNKLQNLLPPGITSINTLPLEIQISILTHLTVKQLLPVQLVSRKFRQLTRTVLLDKFAQTTNNHSSITTVTQATIATMTTATPNIPKPPPTIPSTDPWTISLTLFPDLHHHPSRWHECQTVVFQCTAIDRLQEVLRFQPIDPSSSTFIIFRRPSFTQSQHQYQQQQFQEMVTTRAFRSMEVETELMRRAVRFCSPVIGLNIFDYSTGKRSTDTSRFTPSSSTATSVNPFIHSLGYAMDPLSRFDPTIHPVASTSASQSSGETDPMGHSEYSVIGIKHSGWPTLPTQDEGGYHWGMSSRSDHMDGQAEMDSDEEVMLCLQSEDIRGSVKTMGKRQDDMDVVTMNYGSQPTKFHRHRLLQARYHHGRTPSRFTRYCCLHQNQHRHQHQHQQDREVGQGEMGMNGEERMEGESRVGNKDWWIEYRSIPIDAPVCQRCLQDGNHRPHEGGGSGGMRVELRQILVSLDWVLSGFKKSI